MAADAPDQSPVSGTCARCNCALSFLSSRKDGAWYCCGACAGSDRCECGCKPEHTRDQLDDHYVPTRRMFAARHPDGLRTPPDFEKRARAFPFADKQRGR